MDQMAAMLRPCHCRVHTPTIHAASHVDHKKRVEWFPISMHSCGSISIHVNYGAQLGGPSRRRSSTLSWCGYQTGKHFNVFLN